jgi:hypothetical protein
MSAPIRDMPSASKLLQHIDEKDFNENPVWEFSTDETTRHGERLARPVTTLPVQTLSGRLVATQVLLNNGTRKWAVLSNIALRNPRKTRHFLTLWLNDGRRWFELARYFDVDAHRRGPEALARFLSMSMDEVFPIRYDISAMASGPVSTVQGIIPAEPEERLTDEELIELTLSEDQ